MADAKTIYTVTITNGNSDPTFVGTKQLTLADLAVISPTGITTPQTPYVEWVSDTTARLDGSVQIPAWKRSGTQYFVLPASSKVEFTTDVVDEAIFYKNLNGKIANVVVAVATDPVTDFKISGLKYGAKNEIAIGGEGTAVTAPTATGLTIVDGTATYKSSDESVATVAADGKVTGVKAGTATITYTANYTITGTSLVVTESDSVKITVTES